MARKGEPKDESDAVPMRFGSIIQADVPKGRDGKHKQIVLELLSDLSQLQPGMALKIPLAELLDSKENIRSALSRGHEAERDRHRHLQR